jgi:hypothetical protein
MNIEKLLDNSEIGKKTEEILLDVLSKFPEEIQNFVVDNISIVEFRKGKKLNIENSHIGFCLDTKRYTTRYFIVLDSRYYTEDQDYKARTMAHEIGHAYLGHPSTNTSEVRDEQIEKEADEFADKYGFTLDDEESIKEWFTLRFWTVRRIILVTLIILAFFMVDFAERFEHLLQWVVFMV